MLLHMEHCNCSLSSSLFMVFTVFFFSFETDPRLCWFAILMVWATLKSVNTSLCWQALWIFLFLGRDSNEYRPPSHHILSLRLFFFSCFFQTSLWTTILGPLLGLLAGMFEFANQTGYTDLSHLCRVRFFFAALYIVSSTVKRLRPNFLELSKYDLDILREANSIVAIIRCILFSTVKFNMSRSVVFIWSIRLGLAS